MQQLRLMLSELGRQKILLIAGGLVLLIFLLSLLLYRSDTPSPSPTADGVTVNQRQVITSPLIQKVSPEHGSKDNALATVISVAFTQRLSPEEQGKMKITITPSIPVTTTWQNTTTSILTLKPNSFLKASELYTTTLTLDDKVISQWSFSTAPLSEVSVEEQAQIQAIGDREVADYWKNVSTSYPWYNSLPLQTTTYFVYFDLQTKRFEASLYPTNSSQVETLKTQVTNALTNLGIPVTNIPINWKVN